MKIRLHLIAAIVLVALLSIGAVGLAQDATSDPSATPEAAEQQEQLQEQPSAEESSDEQPPAEDPLAEDPFAAERPVHPAHIHEGTCDAPGSIVVPLSDVSPLTAEQLPAQDGADQVPLALSHTTGIGMSVYDLLEGRIPEGIPGVDPREPEAPVEGEPMGGHFLINVHESADRLDQIVACGDIRGAAADDGTLIIVMQGVNGPGGLAWLSEPDGTTVDIILATAAGMETPGTEPPTSDETMTEETMTEETTTDETMTDETMTDETMTEDAPADDAVESPSADVEATPAP
jgi:hypothetical protein